MKSLRSLAVPLSFALIAAVVSTAKTAEPVTTASLLEEMVDLGHLGTYPEPAYKTFQFSSRDRRSELPNGQFWFGNSDGFGGEPIPGVLKVLKDGGQNGPGNYLLAEVRGPGALVRTWTASEDGKYTGMNGTIRMYLDGDPKPVFDGPAQEFLLHLYPAIAKQHGGRADGLAAGFTQRDAGYYPLPFAKGCRIEWTGRPDDVHFYHIEFRKYADGTHVETFQPKHLDAYRKTIEQVGAILSKPSARPEPKGEAFSFDASLEPGKYHELLHLQNRSGRIAQFEIKLDSKDLNRALRQTALTIFFDHFARPQVESPLGDFFAAAPGINPFSTLPMEVRPDGTMICRFVMPFKQRAHLWLINHSPETVKLAGKAIVDNQPWDDARSMHFYADWRVNHDMQVPGRRGFDIPFVLAQGNGRFVGCSVHLMNPCDIPTGNWWGEGDEKVFVDDDVLPSFFGTGSEDFFNYSWSVPDLFSHAYCAQPRCDGPFTRGFITNNRFHILDSIPFEKRLNFFLEMIHHDVVDGFSYARISYYYGRPGIYSDHMPIFRADIRPPKAPDNWVPAARGRQQGAYFVQMEDMKGGEKFVESGTFWARGKRLAWHPQREGDSLTLSFDVPKAGKHRLYLVMGLSPDSGKVAVALNGAVLRTADGKDDWVLDLYTPFHTVARHFSTEQLMDLPQGANTLTLISRGKNPESQGTLVLGDFLWLQP